MYIKNYKYIVADEVVGNRAVISKLQRERYTSQHIKDDLIDYIKSIQVTGKTALLIAGGPAIHHSDARNQPNKVPDGTTVVLTQMGYNAYNIARMFTVDIDFMSINTNTCASSMYSLYEAKQLFSQGYTDVIVVAIDVIDNVQEMLFKQLGIDLVCGDCISITHLTKDEGIAKIEDVVWKWNKDTSPMSVSSKGYEKVISELDTIGVDLIKTHGSGTDRNTIEEMKTIEQFDCRKIGYKQEIGHTQGCSSIVEICMMLDREKFTKALVLASGLGGFYGGCVVSKE